MKTNQSWLAVLAVVAALAAAQTGRAQSRYTVTDLGTLPGLDYSFVWGGVNSQGHVAGYATNFPDPNVFDGSSSFLWTGPGEMQLLPQLPGATLTLAFALNDSDQVVGSAGPTPTPQSPQGQYVGILWEDGSAHFLNQLPGHTDSDATGINNSGLVVGSSQDFNVDPSTSTAVYWNNGEIFPLPALDGASYSFAIAVSEWGEIIGISGSRAVLWSTSPEAGVIDLGTLGGDGSAANDINEFGQIVGVAQTVFGDWLPVLWDGMDIIELPIPDQDRTGCAFWINNSGQAVGFSGSDPSQGDLHGMHALLWEDGGVIDLQDQIPANSGWKLRQATGINDQGQITGFGQHHGKMRAFLLTPTVAPQANATAPDAFAAKAANKPPQQQALWPAGAELWVDELSTGNPYAFLLGISWPICILADHYRLTVTAHGDGKYHKWYPRVLADRSPVNYAILDSGRAYWAKLFQFSYFGGDLLTKVTVTAYSGPDEAKAYSESLNWPPKSTGTKPAVLQP